MLIQNRLLEIKSTSQGSLNQPSKQNQRGEICGAGQRSKQLHKAVRASSESSCVLCPRGTGCRVQCWVSDTSEEPLLQHCCLWIRWRQAKQPCLSDRLSLVPLDSVLMSLKNRKSLLLFCPLHLEPLLDRNTHLWRCLGVTISFNPK